MAERQAQIPGGAYINEKATAQRRIPGVVYVNETATAAAAAPFTPKSWVPAFGPIIAQ